MKNIADLFPLSVTKTAYSYAEYMELMETVVLENRTTGPKQSEDMNYYTKLNLSRMQRLNKKVEITDELTSAIEQIEIPQTWFILTEAWCGDAAQNVPVIAAAVLSNPLISIKLLLRDENPEIMDQYTTDGGRSIPKLIAVDEEFNELFTWGPRPEGAHKLLLQYKTNSAAGGPVQTHKEFAADVQRWYIADKSESVQKELTTILEALLVEK
ncbi:thioredoxin family protein [Dyadobacter sp. NIV53]|uniref:thioredoxin family protein n=1 Tax=Dyadobacter sp. NIV53 TaxID=2861765 RepID=UPI001C866BA2|nr:thioredoxin family protein [Dyadobacter sp. NIV53]